MAMKAKEYREQLAEAFVHILEEKQLDWKEGWHETGMRAPLNAKSGRRYRGINLFYLSIIAMERGYSDPRWATFKQVQEKGWRLENAKGQGVKVEYWYPYDREDKKMLTWEEFRRTGEEFGRRYMLAARYATVFNGSLIRGMPQLQLPEQNDISLDVLIERLSMNMGVEIMHDGGDQAFYTPSEDRIHLPLAQSFESDYAYASVALHELAHSTGAPHRLNRNLSGGFGSPEYAYEEMVAEISSCFMSANLQVPQNERHVENHKAYVQSWVASVKEKPETLVKAVQQAERTAGYMEYQAELIDKGEYEKIYMSSQEIRDTEIAERKVGNNMEDLQNMDMEFFRSRGWDIKEGEGEYLLLLREEEVLRGNMEAMRQAEERIRYAMEAGELFGKTLVEVRSERGYSRAEMAGIFLMSERELRAIEDGQIFPDKLTMQMIGNIYSVYADELENGRIVPKKTRDELHEMVKEIRNYVEIIRDDTKFFKEFMVKHDIPMQGENIEQMRSKGHPDAQEGQTEYFVVEDRVTGKNVEDGTGKEIRAGNREDAAKIAQLLNGGVKDGVTAEEAIRQHKGDALLEYKEQEAGSQKEWPADGKMQEKQRDNMAPRL